MIVDTHVHIWEMPPIAPIGPSAPNFTSKPTAHGNAELQLADMDANGVDKTVLVQTSFSTWDNEYVAAAGIKYPDRFVSMGLVDPMDDRNAAQAVYWMDEREMQGFRFHPQYYHVQGYRAA
jgi:predicted TIM-barrel fold metal-dependent hydrolase